MELIQIIHEELLKSAELTGIWEKKLREIERRTYNAGQFLEELKQMVSEVVMSVLSDNSNRHITIQAPAPEKGSKVSAKTEAADKPKKEPKKRTPRKSAAAGKKTEQASGAVAGSRTGGFRQSCIRRRLMTSSASLVRFAEKVPLSRGKRLTVVPNGNPDVHSASRLNKGNHIK